jgi:hypothetical protein
VAFPAGLSLPFISEVASMHFGGAVHIAVACLSQMLLSLFSPSLLVGRDIVFRFIIEYSSRLRDFGPLGNNTRSIFYMRIFEKTILLLVLKLENSYRVIIS